MATTPNDAVCPSLPVRFEQEFVKMSCLGGSAYQSARQLDAPKADSTTLSSAGNTNAATPKDRNPALFWLGSAAAINQLLCLHRLHFRATHIGIFRLYFPIHPPSHVQTAVSNIDTFWLFFWIFEERFSSSAINSSTSIEMHFRPDVHMLLYRARYHAGSEKRHTIFLGLR